jgi:non-heme chloroperoxidase
MPAIKINDTSLEYVEKGQGVPVVFVHGSLGDFRSWNLQMEPFSEHYRVIAYSRRYHYPNAEPGKSQDYSVNLHAQDLAALIRGLGLQQPHIVGSSYGAYIALVLTARYPELVRSLVLGEPPLLPWLENSREYTPIVAAFMSEAWEPSKRAFERGAMEEGVRAFINGVLGQEAFDKLPMPIRAAMMENDQEMNAEVLSPGYFSKFTCDDAKKIKAPTLLLTGELSPLMFRYIIEELQRCMPRAERSVIPKSSHMMQAGNPEVYNTQVLSFLSRH